MQKNYGAIESGVNGKESTFVDERYNLLDENVPEDGSIQGIQYIDESVELTENQKASVRSDGLFSDYTSKFLYKGRYLGLICLFIIAFAFTFDDVNNDQYESLSPSFSPSSAQPKTNDTSAPPVKSNIANTLSPVDNSPPFKYTSRDKEDPAGMIVDFTMLPNNGNIRPFPTGSFWTNLVTRPKDYKGSVDQQGTEISYPIATEPYALRWGQNEGLQVSYPALRRTVDALDIQDPFIPDITVSSVEGIKSRQVSDYDLLSATLSFFTDVEGASSMQSNVSPGFKVFAVQGSPYVTTEFVNAIPKVIPQSIFSKLGVAGAANANLSIADMCRSIPLSASWQMKLTGTEFVAVQPEGLTWLLTTSKPVTLHLDCVSKRRLIFAEKFTGIMRLALLPTDAKLDGSAMETLRKHASIYPVSGKVTTKYKSGLENDSDIAEVTFSYSTAGGDADDDILMYVLPHLAPLIEDVALDQEQFDGKLTCIKGEMTPVVGNELTYNETLTSLEFTTGRIIDDDGTKSLLRESLAEDIMLIPPQAEDSYGFGKQAARMANLVLIANEIEEFELQSNAASILKEHMIPWLIGENKNALLYDEDFGGVITTNGLADFMADFGNGRYDDHHFHYGYFIYACAILGKFDNEFVENYGHVVDSIVADVANADSKSKYFPIARHKSWFDGHSWASGLFQEGNGKNQESSSEAVNCYYAVYLWSLVKKDSKLNYFSRLLLASEMRGAKTYWHIGKDSNVYNAEFSRNNEMVGNLGGLDVNSRTWFGTQMYYVYGIQSLPITTITEELFDYEFVQSSYGTAIASSYENIEMGWKGFFVCIHAIIDPVSSWVEAQKLVTSKLDSGISLTEIYYWIATRPVKTTPGNVIVDNKDGVNYSKFCALNSGCSSSQLKGRCCPTLEGFYLGCCAMDSSNTIVKEKSCNSNARCKSLNLQGDCCPTSSGVFLGCCD